MKDYLISMFIDDEMDLDEKMEFVRLIDEDGPFKDEAVGLLSQEKLLRSDLVEEAPAFVHEGSRRPLLPRWRKFFLPAGVLGSALAAALLVVVLFSVFTPLSVTERPPVVSHRFVIYEPDASTVEIAGSFTDWKTLPLKQVAESGYWEVTLDVSGGEHRFVYILDGEREYADPTVLARERDDFGGENSILRVGV